MRHLIIGLGSMGQRHLANLKSLCPDDEFITVDENGKADYETPRADLVRDSLVYICSPTRWHERHFGFVSDHTPRAVFVEKPLFSVNSRWQDLFASRDINFPVVVGFCYRFHPLFQKLRASADRKDIFSFHVYASEASLAGRYTDPPLELLLAHPINTAEWLFGPIQSHKVVSDDKWATFSGTARNGISVSMSANFISPQRISLCIVGVLNRETQSHEQFIYNVWPDDGMYIDEMKAWLNYVETGNSGDLCTLSEAMRTQELLQ